jgi:predicted transposase/invertase (TIGR01784 family)
MYGAKNASGFRGLISLTFLELKKSEQSATKRIRHWMDFFKGKPPTRDAPQYIKEAYRLTEEQDLSEEEVKMIEAIDLAEEDRKGQIAYAREQGEKRGERRGMKLGEKEKARAIAAIANNLLRASMTPELVAAHTGLDLETVRQLQAKL